MQPGQISPEYIKGKIELSQNRMLNFDRAFEQLEPILFYNHNNKILKRVYYAMTWLNKARRSPRFYDRFIFLSIALETLYLISKLDWHIIYLKEQHFL